ncbi:MAG: hypothetical protein IPK99_13930 [Flavobacteriales bacterium]|nr:hypothetical protein [Flavobacteriales bacterium]
MRERLLIVLFASIGLRHVHGQEFVQHHVPNDSIGGEPPVVSVLRTVGYGGPGQPGYHIALDLTLIEDRRRGRCSGQ